MTQAALASKLGVSQQSVSKWLHNVSLPALKYLPSIAKTFGKSEAEVLEYLAHTELPSVTGNSYVDAVQEDPLLKPNEKRLFVELYAVLTKGRG